MFTALQRSNDRWWWMTSMRFLPWKKGALQDGLGSLSLSWCLEIQLRCRRCLVGWLVGSDCGTVNWSVKIFEGKWTFIYFDIVLIFVAKYHLFESPHYNPSYPDDEKCLNGFPELKLKHLPDFCIHIRHRLFASWASKQKKISPLQQMRLVKSSQHASHVCPFVCLAPRQW